MAKPDVGVFLRSVVWTATGGTKTWNATTGGIQSIDFDKGGEPLAHWAGDDILPRWQSFVRQMVDITIGFDFVDPDIVEGQKGTLTFVIVLADLTTTKTIACTNMKLVRITHSQSEAVAGNMRCRFVHESDDGVSDPVSVT